MKTSMIYNILFSLVDYCVEAFEDCARNGFLEPYLVQLIQSGEDEITAKYGQSRKRLHHESVVNLLTNKDARACAIQSIFDDKRTRIIFIKIQDAAISFVYEYENESWRYRNSNTHTWTPKEPQEKDAHSPDEIK
jgi:hypothetical protein